MKTKRKPMIAVVIWMNQDYGRRVFAGILDYAHNHNFKGVELYDASLASLEKHAPDLAKCDGAIAVLEPYVLGRQQKLPRPFVLVPRLFVNTDVPTVATEPETVARLAAEHLLSLHLTSFAAVSFHGLAAHQTLDRTFREQVSATSGCTCAGTMNIRIQTQKEPVHAWLKSLPRPCGILCDQDESARKLIARATELDLRVPQDIVVIGLGDDNLHAMMSHPTVTTIDLPAERIGFLAAQVLDETLRGKPTRSIPVRPTSIISRGSTNMLAIQDRTVAAAVHFIREHFTSPIDATDVAHALGLPRTTLQTHFEKVMNTTIHEELVRCRLQTATRLLSDTEEPIKRIAIRSGIPDLPNFCRFIKKHTGRSPRDYRVMSRQT